MRGATRVHAQGSTDRAWSHVLGNVLAPPSHVSCAASRFDFPHVFRIHASNLNSLTFACRPVVFEDGRSVSALSLSQEISIVEILEPGAPPLKQCSISC